MIEINLTHENTCNKESKLETYRQVHALPMDLQEIAWEMVENEIDRWIEEDL